MTMFLENRTISMILTVPNVKELTNSTENLDSFSKTPKPPSIPIYHGSIVHIEQHRDNQNTSDLIVRVPNFHHVSLPRVTISTIPADECEARPKRRAPICPILNGRNTIENSNFSESEIKLTNTKRIAIGLRNLRRTIITNWKLKRTTNINEITLIPVLPDVEVLTENIQRSKVEKKSQNFTSKFLFIKPKLFKIRKKQPSPNSTDIQENTEENEQPIPNTSTSSTHHYSGVSSEDISSTDILQPETFISNAKIDLTTDIQSVDNINEELYVVDDNGDTYSECYEITYEIDPDYQHFIDNEKEQIYLPEIQGIELNLDPFEYPWLPLFPSNDYEQIDQSQKDSNLEQEPHITRVKFQSSEDLSQTSHDQTSTYQPESISSLQDNNQIIYLNDSSMINEDYTVILQFLKHALQIETNSDDHELE